MENRPTVDLVVGEILKYGCFEDSDVLASWTEDETLLFQLSLEEEGVPSEEVDEIIIYFDAIATMYAVAAELLHSEGDLSEGDYWRKTLETLAKYSSLLPRVREELAGKCPHSDQQTVDCDEPLYLPFLVCAMRSEKNPCPEGLEICCAQCDAISRCTLACSQFEGMVVKRKYIDLSEENLRTRIKNWLSEYRQEYFFILKQIDGYLNDIAEGGIEEILVRHIGYPEGEDWVPPKEPREYPLWVDIVDELEQAGYSDEEALKKMRQVRELFMQALAERIARRAEIRRAKGG